MDKSLIDATTIANILQDLKNADQKAKFLRDLLTAEELATLCRRWQAAIMLNNNDNYLDIIKATKLSSTTVARVQKWLSGSLGGYQLAIHHHLNRKRRD